MSFRSNATEPTTSLATEREVAALLGQLVSTDGASSETGNKLASLRAAKLAGIDPMDLGTFAAMVKDHPWSVTVQACADIDDLLRVWPTISAAGSAHNTTEVFRPADQGTGAHRGTLLLVRRFRREGGLTDLLEDEFVLGLLRGMVQRVKTPYSVGNVAAVEETEVRTWRLTLRTVEQRPAGGLRWGAAGPTSQALLDAFADRGDATSLREAAAVLMVSARTLQRRLSAEGTTFQDVRQRSRLAAAARYVASGETLTDAAHASGFADGAHLSRDFQRLVGVRAVEWSRLAR